MSIDGVWIKPTAEQAKWFNEGVDTAKEILRQQEAGLAAVTAERDALLKDKARLDWLETAGADISHHTLNYESWVQIKYQTDYRMGMEKGATVRDAIDAALRGKGES